MSTHAVHPRAVTRLLRLPLAAVHAAWLAAGLALGFLVPFVLADTLELQRDVYYALYGLVAVALFAAWARSTGQSVGELLARRWLWATALGGVMAAALAFIAVRTETSDPRPDRLELVGAVAWRGVFYGAVDGLLLSSFPILVVFAAFGGTRLRGRLAGKAAIGAVALVASLAMTAIYHVGYSDFRGAKVAKPLSGDVLWSAPTLLTLNPVGAPIAHIGLHTAAVLHSYRTDVFLPPHANR